MVNRARRRYCIILNPTAGSADEAERLIAALNRVPNVRMRETKQGGDATRFAAEAVEEGFDVVVAAGGDGTLNEVLNGLTGRYDEIVLGLLPMGTGNDLARTLDIPLEPEHAVEILNSRSVARIDLFRVTWAGGTRLAANASTGGFSSIVGRNLSAENKSWLGSMSYLISAGASLPELEEYEITLSDGGNRSRILAYNFTVSNGRTIGGGILVSPQADPTDGLLDLLLVPAMPLTSLTGLLSRMAAGRQEESPHLIRRRASRFEIDCRPAVTFNIDGEVVGKTPVTYEVLPGAVRMLLQPSR